MGARGTGAGQRSTRGPNPIEGLGHDRTSYLMHGCRPYYGDGKSPYKTEAAARKDWKVYRTRLLAMEKDWTRRPWAFWVFEQGMDDAPIGGEQGAIILAD